MTHTPSASKVAIVTGAGTGIGLAVSRRLAAAGYSLCLIGRRTDVLQAAAAELSRSVKCHVHTADVGELSQAAGCVDAAVAAFQRLDVVINNAGYAPVMAMDAVTNGEIERIFRVNAMGPSAIIGRAWPVMVRGGGGCIVNISSFATVDPFPGLGIYGAAKAACNLLAKACHNEGRTSRIRAFSVAPGAVETAMLRANFPVEALPTSRTLSPDQVAAVVLECVEGARDSQNGQTILVPSP